MAHSGLGSIPGPGVTCGLSLLLVLVLAQRIHVSPSLLVFLPPQKKKKQTNKQAKNKKNNSNSTWKQRTRRTTSWNGRC